jgi:acyl-CoA synthetase (AMP-forming)/AMP-acid ligase II/thioesterase domain-containing protein/acyl carrier protein
VLSVIIWYARLIVQMSSNAHPFTGLQASDLRTLSARDAVALVRPGQRSFSFLQCAAAADRIAQGLQAEGIHRGDLIALAIPNADQLLLGFLGVASVAAAAPLDCKLAEPELQSRVLQLKPRAMVTSFEPDPRLVRAADATGTPLLSVRFPPRREEQPEIAWRRPRTVAPASRSVAADVVAVFQTSATTGAPKLAPLTHRSLAAMMGNVQRSFGLRADDRFLCLMPLHHLSGLLSCLAQVFRGGTAICSNAFDPGQFLAWLETYRPSWYLAGPAIHRAILQLVQERPNGFPQTSLRFIRSGTAAIQPSLVEALERLLRVPMIHGYGMTEAGVITNTGFHDRTPGSVGKSIGVEVGIMAPDGSLLPRTLQGEIVLRGEEVMNGYLDDPDANRAAFHNGWFRTGDLGWLTPDGDVFITGRLREMINRGGQKILPHEIDAVLAEHPAVEQTAAFAIPHPALGEDIAAAVVLRQGAVADETEMRNYMAARVGAARLPSRMFFVDEIPVTATGKPSRRQLAQLFAGAAHHAPAPRNSPCPNASGDPMEQRIAVIWSRVLGVPAPLQENESFFALGGDSLAVAQMLTIIEAEIGVDVRRLAWPRFLAAPTIATLRDAITEYRMIGNPPPSRPGVSALVLQERGKGPPFLCFPGATLSASYLGPLARLVGDAQPFVVLRDTTWDTGANGYAFEDLVRRFVDYIRDTQPRPLGPIGGHCFGGILAMECACRLEALGCPVPSVVLFDTAAPGYPKPLRHWMQYLKRAPRFAWELRRGSVLDAGREAIAHVRFLSNKSPQSGCTGRPVPGSAREARPITGASLGNAAAAIMHSYVPRPFGGSIVNFMAADRPVSARVLEDARLGWRDFARGGFESHRVPGGHDSMFSEEHVAQLADLLRDILNGVRRGPSNTSRHCAPHGKISAVQ